MKRSEIRKRVAYLGRVNAEKRDSCGIPQGRRAFLTKSMNPDLLKERRNGGKRKIRRHYSLRDGDSITSANRRLLNVSTLGFCISSRITFATRRVFYWVA